MTNFNINFEDNQRFLQTFGVNRVKAPVFSPFRALLSREPPIQMTCTATARRLTQPCSACVECHS